MPLVHDRCICLRKVEYSESSQILTLFGRSFGRVQLIAKGAHRRTKAGAGKFDGGVDLLDLGDAVFAHAPERDLCPLTEWHLVDGHLELRRDIRSMHLGLCAAELVNLFLEDHDPHADLFDRMQHALGELGTPGVEESFLAFGLALLRGSGYLPELSTCVQCGTTLHGRSRERAFFSPRRGGVVCRNCEMLEPDRIEMDVRLLGVVNNVITAHRLPRLTRHQTDPINAILLQHVQHQLGRPLKMTRWVVAPMRATHRSQRPASSETDLAHL